MLSLFLSSSRAQDKPLIDTTAINQWTQVRSPAISDNGQYIAYKICLGYNDEGTLYIKSLKTSWNTKIDHVANFAFSSDSRTVITLNENDTLRILKTGSDQITVIPDVKTFKLTGKEWLVYVNSNQNLIVKNISSEKTFAYNNVKSWYQIGNSNDLILIRSEQNEQVISYVKNNRETQLGKFKNISDLIIDKENKQIAFIESKEQQDKQVYYLKPGSSSAKMLPIQLNNFSLDGLQEFGPDGKQILVKLKGTGLTQNQHKMSEVKVWNYQDTYLKSVERPDNNNGSYLAALDIQTGTAKQIETKDATINFFAKGDNYFILNEAVSDVSEVSWNRKITAREYVYEITSGTKKEIPIKSYSLSPDQKFIFGSSANRKLLVCYNMETGDTITVGKWSSSRWLAEDSSDADNGIRAFGGWTGAHTLLLYDKYDIWEINPDHPIPVNLTNGFGRKNKLKIRFAFRTDRAVYTEKNIEILSVFDINTKKNGFYRLNREKDPVRLSMNDQLFNVPGENGIPDFYPVKAKQADVWIVRAQKSSQAPNYFTTTDFIKFKQISENYPERSYNWLTTELLNFRMADGKMNKAILYKPENFDSTKKYPVILTYYEKVTDNLNTFLTPELSSDHINIPWFVSRGYIICTPDIIYKAGVPGESALNAVNGVTDLLCKMPFIDTTKMAVHGHSFGGYETNYIIVHSNRYAAAMSACGIGDIVSDFNSLWGHGPSKQDSYELGQFSMLYTLWQRPDLYIKNSPIFDANNINTPLLMMNNPKDAAVSFSQGVEFFTALRRLGKKVWMLEYKDAQHSLLEQSQVEDYTKKLEEFFGHYLKNEPMPEWMKPSQED
jgi:dipeptidyl aminopeptidase/acylaminoacyl peptidase